MKRSNLWSSWCSSVVYVKWRDLCCSPGYITHNSRLYMWFCVLCRPDSFVACTHTKRVTADFKHADWVAGGCFAISFPTSYWAWAASLLSASCVALSVCECVFFRQLFDLQSLDCYSCGGDLDAETRRLPAILKRHCTSLSPMCETNTHCDAPLLDVCAHEHHRTFSAP